MIQVGSKVKHKDTKIESNLMEVLEIKSGKALCRYEDLSKLPKLFPISELQTLPRITK